MYNSGDGIQFDVLFRGLSWDKKHTDGSHHPHAKEWTGEVPDY
jgi:hypothetical protein